jgi:crossover junction endodeoxyribonuclease RuvC
MFVLGIDPGLTRCGYGALRRIDARRTEAVDHGVLRTPVDDPLPARLAALLAGLEGLLDRHRPDVVVVERVFFQVNARTAMAVAQASGLALALASARGCEVVQYTANEVKQAVTGHGAADKRAVQVMVQRLLALPALPTPADAADALALALCHAAVAPQRRQLQQGSGSGAGAGGGAASGPGWRVATSLGGVPLAVRGAS